MHCSRRLIVPAEGIYCALCSSAFMQTWGIYGLSCQLGGHSLCTVVVGVVCQRPRTLDGFALIRPQQCSQCSQVGSALLVIPRLGPASMCCFAKGLTGWPGRVWWLIWRSTGLPVWPFCDCEQCMELERYTWGGRLQVCRTEAR